MEQKRVALGNGIELDVVDEGPAKAAADGQTLIFLHGFPESHRTWRHQIAHFAHQGYRCIAPDQRGYRGSSKPARVEDYAPNKLIGDVFRLADALEVETFGIVGHDWGGSIAWGVALKGQHDRVNRAVIANAPHPTIFPRLLYTHKDQRAYSQYFRGFRDRANDALVQERGLAGILQQEMGYSEPSGMEPEDHAALVEDWQNVAAAFGMLNYYRASPMVVPDMNAPFELPADYTAFDLPKLTIPTLVVWGMQDSALVPENLIGLEEVVDPLTIARIETAGHFVPWGAPGEVIAAMEKFLQL